MGIRSNANTKDHLREKAPTLALAPPVAVFDEPEDPLRFTTAHADKPCFVDLTVFQSGETERARKGGIWNGAFSARPQLINELAPAVRDQLMPLAEKSVEQYLHSLRAWWRLLDDIEARAPALPAVSSTGQLTDLHRQAALDKGFDRRTFSNFVRLANTTRAALGLRQLHWQAPQDKQGTRHLAATWQTDLVRRELKHRWFAAMDRWELAAQLRAGDFPPVNDEQRHLLRSYRRFDDTVKRTKHPRPTVQQLWSDIGNKAFYNEGFSAADMLRGSYPDGDDIRAAFHLCLATTGWNPAVLLSLDVNDPFIEPHPKDASRYVLRGSKARAGGAEQVSEGLFKSQGSAGVVLQTLIARTEPLRKQLGRELEDCQKKLEDAALAQSEASLIRQRVTTLKQGLRSPWLFATQAVAEVQWLTDDTFATSVEKLTSSYMGDLIQNLNRRQPDDRKLARIAATDLRDAYAVNAYHASGGSILSVMKALGHRHPRTTQIYLHNTLLREEHRKLYGTFSTALWDEMSKNGRIDPTILAKISRDGRATAEERERLTEYRTIMMSRVGVGCSDPHHPPRHIDPSFVADGKAMCSVQRCTLCYEHAVILPESRPGLCKRLAELRHLRTTMTMGAFLNSSFAEELENTELALAAFDAEQVEREVADWTSRIADGRHRVVEFDGLPTETAQ